MSRKKEPMRKIKEVLRLQALEALSERQITKSANMRRSTVRDYLRRAAAAGLTWEQVQGMDEQTLDHLLFPQSGRKPRGRVQPDWAAIHTELRRPHVTLQLLWEEYQSEHPDGYRYSRFCDLYRRYASRVDVSMRQTHVAGEKLFVDYSGDACRGGRCAGPGRVRTAEIFVAVLGASNYTYAEATWTQRLPDWIGVSYARLRVPGRRAGHGGTRQLESRCAEGFVLRSGDQPDLSAHGRVLRCCRGARARGTSEGQGQGRSGRATGRTMDTGASAQPHVLHAGRTQRGDRGAVHESQRPAVPQDVRIAPIAVRVAGRSGAAPVAGRSLRPR